MNQLTTPELRNHDPVFPGENWFFYWKSSPSLWEEKLSQYQGSGPLFVPINWSLHSEQQGLYDFGQTRPETDLVKLLECAKSARKEIVFLVALSPMPFISNGGVPAYLVRNLSQSKDGLALSVLDGNQQVNRIYSFFDTTIFQAYRKYIWNLGQFFSQRGVSVPLFGLDCFHSEDNHLISFFTDHSKVFDAGFNRYVKQLEESNPEKIEKLLSQNNYENNLKDEYTSQIKDLYLETCKEYLAGNWAGVINSCLLGSGKEDIFRRTSDMWESESDYFLPLLNSVVNGLYPASCLLGPHLKQGALQKAFEHIIDGNLVRDQFKDDFYSDESNLDFKPLVFFKFINTLNNTDSLEADSLKLMMNDTGLKTYLDSKYAWAFKIKNELEISTEDIDDSSVYFFMGKTLDHLSLNKALQLFMNGQKVFLDRNGLPENLDRKIEIFLAENDLSSEKINFVSSVLKVSLGEGILLVYDGQKLAQESFEKRTTFWDTMISFLNIGHLKIDIEQGVYYFWKTRPSNTFELNYQEIRRVSFFNPTSYKKNVFLPATSNFAFIRAVDQVNVELKSSPSGINLAMLPGASINLDFGYFE